MKYSFAYFMNVFCKISIVILVEINTLLSQPANEEPPFFNIAFSEKLFIDVNENDATALAKVLTENLLEQSPLAFRMGGPNVQSNIEEMEKSIRNGENDLYVLLPYEYLQLEKFGLIEPISVASCNNSVYSVFQLIVSKKSNIKELKDLKGKKILIGYSVSDDNAHLWFDYLLSSKGLVKKEKFFEKIEISSKSLQAILKVYFGQADACIISEENLNLAIEMNPHLATSFTTLEFSKPILRSVLAERKNKSEKNKKLLLDNLLNLDKTAEGKQILTLFKMDKLVPFKKDYLDSSYEILQAKLK